MTTVPKPAIVKTRSIGRRGRPVVGRARSCWSRRSSMPTGRPGPARVIDRDRARSARRPASCPRRASSISAFTSSSHSSSTRSAFVRTIDAASGSRAGRGWRGARGSGASRPRRRRPRAARCRSPPTPASMFLMKRSWPGTSTMLTSWPLGSVSQAKPRSMVIPRSFSSARRSGSMPVSAWTSVDLPWSTWPAGADDAHAATPTRVATGRAGVVACRRGRRRVASSHGAALRASILVGQDRAQVEHGGRARCGRRRPARGARRRRERVRSRLAGDAADGSAGSRRAASRHRPPTVRRRPSSRHRLCPADRIGPRSRFERVPASPRSCARPGLALASPRR